MRLAMGLSALALVGAACSSTPAKTTGAPKASTPPAFSMQEKEWKISGPAVVPAGAVTINVTNDGNMEHEMVVLRTDLSPAKLPRKGIEVDEDNAALSSPGEIEDIAPGTTKSKTFTLAAGHYVMICNITGHYSSGMRTQFTVA